MKQKLSILLLPVLLFGCLNYEQITTIYGNHSGKMFVHYWTNKIDLSDTAYIGSLKIFNEETIFNEYVSKDVEITNLEIYTDFNDSTLHAKIELKFQNVDSLRNSKAFKNAGISIQELPDGNNVFTHKIQPYLLGFGFNPSDYHLKYVYYLPGKIMNHNANDLSGNRLTWIFGMDELDGGKILSAVFKPYPLKETPPIIYYLALFVLFVVFFYIFKKRSG